MCVASRRLHCYANKQTSTHHHKRLVLLFAASFLTCSAAVTSAGLLGVSEVSAGAILKISSTDLRDWYTSETELATGGVILGVDRLG